jgi:hypothetical protein
MVTPIGTREARSSNVARRIIARIANRRNIDFSIPATLGPRQLLYWFLVVGKRQ